MITDPRFAPRRNDLSYLRRRSSKKLRSAEPAPPAPPNGGGRDAAVADFFAGAGPHHERHRQPAPAPPEQPQPPAARPAAPHAPTPAPAAPVSSSLDLDAAPPAPAPAPAPAPPAAATAAAPSAARVRAYPVSRVTGGGRSILNRKTPTLTLTRTQSGIGTLTIEAACSAEVGDLRLGCAYQLRSGESSTVQASGGTRLAPPRSRRPVLVGGHDRYERISVDLRQSTDVERLAVFAFSESRAELRWGGTLIVTTLAGAKVELPLEQLEPGGVAVLLSVYNVDGEFVLRAEMETIAGSIREAARAYGYDQITWLDDRNPVE